MKCNCNYALSDEDGIEKHYDSCRTMWEQRFPGKTYPKNADGTLKILNDHLLSLNVDILYHLGFDTHNDDLPAMFGDVKFVCMGGTKYRMREFAEYMNRVLDLSKCEKLINLTKHSKRYAMYKVGPVLSVSHGIGIPSMVLVLQELIKLMCYAKAKDPIFFRIGTSGGLGVTPGSVIISSFGLNGSLEKAYSFPVLGKVRKIPAFLDKRLSQEVQALSSTSDGFETHLAGTMGSDDFYRGQGRLDGPFCDYTESDKMEFLNQLMSLGVRNIEMEAPAFAAITNEAGIRAAIVCVTLLNRLLGDQVTPNKSTLKEWEMRSMIVVGRFIEKYFKNKLD